MITIDHIRQLTATELRIVSYMSIYNKELNMTQNELATELHLSGKQVGVALRSLEERGLLIWNRGTGYNKNSVPTKGTITLH